MNVWVRWRGKAGETEKRRHGRKPWEKKQLNKGNRGESLTVSPAKGWILTGLPVCFLTSDYELCLYLDYISWILFARLFASLKLWLLSICRLLLCPCLNRDSRLSYILFSKLYPGHPVFAVIGWSTSCSVATVVLFRNSNAARTHWHIHACLAKSLSDLFDKCLGFFFIMVKIFCLSTVRFVLALSDPLLSSSGLCFLLMKFQELILVNLSFGRCFWLFYYFSGS